MQKRYVRPDGTPVWVNLSVSLARDACGTPLHFISVVEDISAEKAAELSLRESEQRLRVLADAIPEMVWTTGPSGKLDYCNRHWQQYTSFEFDDSKRWRWTSALHPDDVEPCISAWRTALRAGESFTMQCRYRRASDGTYRWHRCRVSPCRNDEGKLIQWIGTAVDIHNQKQINEQLERAVAARTAELNQQKEAAEDANRAKSTFLANMSHELRTPLNSILGFTEILQDELAPEIEPEQKDFLARIHSSASHLLQLINDVLDLAKVEAGRLHARPEWLDAGALARHVTASLESIAARNGLTMKLTTDPELRPAWADPQLAKQVMYNYVANALKFTPRGGSVTIDVSSREDAGAWRISVSDTGPGIEPAAIGRLFRKFEQLDNTSTKRHAGTGLGLALVKSMVELHGGDVGVISPPGAGATFFAAFPGAQCISPATEENEAACV
jgi:PAS domain S-box-containing protein